MAWFWANTKRFPYRSKTHPKQEYAGSNVQVRLRSDDGQEFNAIWHEDHFFSHNWHEGDDIYISLDPAKIHPLSAKSATARNLQQSRVRKEDL